MKRKILFIACTSFLLCSPENPSGPSIDKYRTILESVQVKVQNIRGLTFQRKVHFAILSRNEYANRNNSYSSPVMQFYSRELKQLGFIPDTMNDLGKQVESYDEQFVAAFYVPGTDSIYVIDADNYNQMRFEYYTAHELTHALQEQCFNPFAGFVYPALSQSKYNSDFYLAQLCVTEGDACLTMDYYYITEIDRMSEQDLFDSYTSGLESFYSSIGDAEIPRYLEISKSAPYVLGLGYVARKKQSDDWAGVNDLFNAKRISSTAEIITSVPGQLVSFDFSKISPILLKNARNLKFADDDTHGPIMLMALLSDYTDVEHCRKAFGWQGDRIVYVLKDDNTYGSFVWALSFQTVEDADYMISALDNLISDRKLANSLPVREENVNSITFTLPGVTTVLIKQNNSIIWVENVENPSQIASLLQPGALAKIAVDEDYSTISKEGKWRLLKKLVAERNINKW